MSTIDRSLDVVAFVSDHFRDIVRRRVSELVGLALLTLALLAACALASWSVQDPSLSHATRMPVHNLLGTGGAIVSDLLMQLFGLASVTILLPLAINGWRLLAHRQLVGKLRQALWISVLLLAAAFAACLPKTSSWPLPTGLGGVCGDALLLVAQLFGLVPTGFSAFCAALVLGTVTLLGIAVAGGVRVPAPEPMLVARKRKIEPDEDDADDQEEQEEGSSAISLGMVTPAFLSEMELLPSSCSS